MSVTATPGELAPMDSVTLTVTNPPDDALFLQAGYSNSGIERVEFVATGPAQGDIQLFFRPPGSLFNDTYQDSIEVHVCTDDQCQDEIAGSPKTIRIAYVVSGDGLTTATISRTAIEVTADQRETSNREETTTVTLSNLPPSGVFMQATESSNAIQHVGSIDLGTVRDVVITFSAPSGLSTGTHDDAVALKLCYDESCVRQVGGSPFTISTSFNVTLGIEPGLSSLQVLRREPLGHDVIDAEFSKALNAIVMVGSYPSNAIYVYDVTTGVESEQALNRSPTSLSVAPDGLTAAVGHDALISVVDLPMDGAAGAPAPVLLSVRTTVRDLVLDGSGHVFAMPRIEQGDHIHSIDIATNTEQLSGSSVERIKLHPSGDYIYGVPGFVPSELIKWDVTSGVATWLYSWQYFGEHTACLDLWFSEGGDTVYTGCGETFSANADPSQDMIYGGTIPLTQPADFNGISIRSLSHSATHDEVALIESHFSDCTPVISFHPCYTRLAYYDDAFLNRQALYGIGPVAIGGVGHAHNGRFVFHDAVGSRKYLIGELEEPPSEDLRFWLSVVE